jgi:DTW domain-containing protein YfiP
VSLVNSRNKNHTMRLFAVPPTTHLAPPTTAAAATLSVVLLTHANELARGTNTGNLLWQQQQLQPPTAVVGCTRWTWQGRKDNAAIARALLGVPCPVLVWTEAPHASAAGNAAHGQENGTLPTYVILDGTWQEAKKMFRQGPDALRTIPRIALKASFPSSYRLRQNFGYVGRFGTTSSGDDDEDDSSNSSGCNLLCTAEVVAALLELHGDESGSLDIRKRLDTFQSTFYSGKAHNRNPHDTQIT